MTRSVLLGALGAAARGARSASFEAAATGYAPCMYGSVSRCQGDVLIVEDEDDVREMMELAVSRRGHDVITAGSGREAIELLTRRRSTPCVVLLDLMLPELDGWAVRAHMLRSPRLRDIPVVIVTAMSDLGEERRAALEPAELVHKPVHLGHLFELIERHCASVE